MTLGKDHILNTLSIRKVNERVKWKQQLMKKASFSNHVYHMNKETADLRKSHNDIEGKYL